MDENLEIGVPEWEIKGNSQYNLSRAKAEYDFYREGINIFKGKKLSPADQLNFDNYKNKLEESKFLVDKYQAEYDIAYMYGEPEKLDQIEEVGANTGVFAKFNEEADGGVDMETFKNELIANGFTEEEAEKIAKGEQ